MNSGKFKRLKWVIVLLVVALIGVGIWGVASFLVKNGRSVEDIEEKLSANETPVPTAAIVYDVEEGASVIVDEDTEYMSYKDEDTGMKGMKYPSCMYDTEDVVARQDLYLKGSFDNVLSKIEEEHEMMFEKLRKQTIDRSVEREEYTVIEGFEVTFDDIISHDLIYFKDILDVIGLYDNTCIVYYLDLEEEKDIFLVVDYKNTPYPENMPLLDFGDVRSVKFLTSVSVIQEFSEHLIIYTEGY